MPGCCAPNCSNSTQKGYRLYHFPADPERCALWVKNCGRESGWQPTKHTCICDTHFEESQFESHRADGLKKLKPFAIPTKFSKTKCSSVIRMKKKIDDKQQDAGTKFKTENMIIRTSISSLQNKDLSTDILINENMQPLSVITKPFSNSSESLRKYDKSERNKRKRKISVICKSSVRNVVQNTGSELINQNEKSNLDFSILSTKSGSYTRSSIDVLNESKLQKLSTNNHCSSNSYTPLTKYNESKVQKRRKFKSDIKKIRGDVAINEINICFICNQSIENGIPLSSCAQTSKIPLVQKFIQLVIKEFDMLVEDSDMLCVICAQTLNCIDYVESVLHTLNKGIVNLVKKKLGIKPIDEIDLLNYIKYLKNLNDFYGCKKGNAMKSIEQKHSEQIDSNQDTNQCNMPDVILDGSGEKQMNQTLSSSEFECKICSFKTPFSAILRYHLRQHYQNVYSCDFCRTPVILDPSLLNEHLSSYTCS